MRLQTWTPQEKKKKKVNCIQYQARKKVSYLALDLFVDSEVAALMSWDALMLVLSSSSQINLFLPLWSCMCFFCLRHTSTPEAQLTLWTYMIHPDALHLLWVSARVIHFVLLWIVTHISCLAKALLFQSLTLSSLDNLTWILWILPSKNNCCNHKNSCSLMLLFTFCSYWTSFHCLSSFQSTDSQSTMSIGIQIKTNIT